MSNPAGFFQLKITIDGQDRVLRKFSALAARIADFSPAWEKVGGSLRADFALNMVTEGARYGGWAPLKPSTVREKARKYPGAPMEWRTGTLGRSLAEEGAPGNVSEIHAMSAMFGTRISYAGFQHFGTSRGLPARKLVGVRRETREIIVRDVGDFIRQSIRESGFE